MNVGNKLEGVWPQLHISEGMQDPFLQEVPWLHYVCQGVKRLEKKIMGGRGAPNFT